MGLHLLQKNWTNLQWLQENIPQNFELNSQNDQCSKHEESILLNAQVNAVSSGSWKALEIFSNKSLGPFAYFPPPIFKVLTQLVLWTSRPYEVRDEELKLELGELNFHKSSLIETLHFSSHTGYWPDIFYPSYERNAKRINHKFRN